MSLLCPGYIIPTRHVRPAGRGEGRDSGPPSSAALMWLTVFTSLLAPPLLTRTQSLDTGRCLEPSREERWVPPPSQRQATGLDEGW